MKDVIYERDIKKVTISDGTAGLTYTKQNKDSNLYDLRYQYATEQNEQFCQYCGKVWHVSEGNICQDCGGKAREVYESDTVVDMVYCMLEDGCTVTIDFWDGNVKKYEL